MSGLLRRARQALMVVTLPVILVVLWWIVTRGSTSFYFPPLSRIVSAFGETWTGPRLHEDVVPSLLRLVIGYFAAVLIGLAAGMALGMRARLRMTFEPVLEFFRAIPPPTLVPLLILLAGVGNTMKVIVIVLGAVWPVLLNTIEGVRNVDTVLREVADCYGIVGARRFRTLTLRAASPQIFTGMRQALSIAIILMVIGEMFSSTNGIGFQIIKFQRGFAIPEMWSGIILLGLIGVAAAVLFRLGERAALRWYEGLRAAPRAEG